MKMGPELHRSARVALTLVFASVAGATGSAYAQETKVTIVVPNPSAINNFPLHVAIGEGYFKEQGLDVTVEAVNGSASVLQSMAAGQAQIGNPGPGPLLGARARGEDVVFIYNQFPKSIFGLVVKEESAIKTPTDLKGTTVGVGTADGAEVGFSRAILSKVGLAEGNDYKFLAVGDGGTAAAAFLNNEVESYAAAVSDAAIIGARGIPLREITPEEFLSFFGNGWAVTRSYLDTNPKVIEGFGKALVKATKFGLDPANKDAVLAHAAVGNPQEAEDPKFAAALLTAIQDRVTPLDVSTGYGYQPPEHWKMWHESQVATGALSKPLDDLNAAYTNDFVKAWNE
ncbi:ABC transporter substrate-binding protein [Aminobacter sp. P9b]|uniref:ABC transporter substrate-binding protein n=1 Tax=Aminobacter TaxID=31988 RepID=UPI000D505DAD|nr:MULTISPECIES: ABC transporter substrate-binding protein [Aminobacter]AWC24221.1 taurine transporter substrate binding subunit [Aminobacter sp. MSH1]CAI2934932.1 Taurine transporter substrate binding subunit [Aminobacter niigataensis]